jgi:ABC-2 type transport system ATP-binding protein
MAQSGPTTPDTLVVETLSKRFGDLQAVNDLSFRVAAGETFGLLGPNGAGKTTAISMICGLLDPDSGTITVNGTAIKPGSTAGREFIGYVPQEIALYLDLTGLDNLRYFARLYGLKGATAASRIAEVLDIVGLADRADDLVDKYSGGMQRRLNIAAGMLHRPKLLILDEPTVGIDPQSRNAILDAVDRLGAEGMSVLYTTHYMEEAERLCDRIGIVDRGQLLACGTRRELVALVDEHDRIVIGVDGDAARIADELRTQPEIVEASAADDRTVEASVDRAELVLPQLMAHLSERGVPLSRIQVIEPSLDSVFLHITGTALRD